MEINKIKKAAEIAKAKTTDKRWVAAIDKAVATLLNSKLIVTVLTDNSGVVTSENGSYTIRHGFCPCPARVNHCYHIAALRICNLADEMPEPTKPQAPVITRCIERDYNGERVTVVRCNGWMI
jgi:predicted nucleic acid-binding Zn finger protein